MLLISALNAHIKRVLAGVFLALSLPAAGHAEPAQERLTIFAAASLTDVLPDLELAWRQETGFPQAQISFAASAVLARQIQAGAPVDVFLSANRQWVDHLTTSGEMATYAQPVVHNSIVLAAPCSNQRIDLHASQLESFLASNRFAMADPAVAPLGAYAKSYLERTGIWPLIRKNATYAGNARLSLLLIERGGLPGFVYGSDAHASQNTCILLDLPISPKERVTYYSVADSSNQTATAFAQWLQSENAMKIWETHGFQPVSK